VAVTGAGRACQDPTSEVSQQVDLGGQPTAGVTQRLPVGGVGLGTPVTAGRDFWNGRRPGPGSTTRSAPVAGQ
jgi:hypothetical protein